MCQFIYRIMKHVELKLILHLCAETILPYEVLIKKSVAKLYNFIIFNICYLFQFHKFMK